MHHLLVRHNVYPELKMAAKSKMTTNFKMAIKYKMTAQNTRTQQKKRKRPSLPESRDICI